jgi:transposase
MQGTVVRVETERDIELLRQTAMLLEAENARLHQRLVQLTRELAEAKGATATQLELEIKYLQEQLAARTRKIFGASSEKRPRDGKEDEAEKAPRQGHGPRAQRELAVVEEIHDLDEADRMCPKCGGDLKSWEGQFEESEEVDVVERSFRVVKHKRKKYRCQCGCIETALGPPKLIPGGRYSIGFAVEAAIAKYCDHLPLARQVRQMARAALVIDSQTLWDQLWALTRHLHPTYEALHTYVLQAPAIGADETTWPVLGKGSSKKWWAWAVSRPDAVCYRILPSRSAEAAAVVLGEYRGIVVADGYSAYRALQKEISTDGTQPTFTLACCMAHCRRKFVEAEPDYPQVSEVLDLIGKLYEIEARARQVPDHERLTFLTEVRDRESRPLMGKIRQWMVGQAALPRSALGKAIGYSLELWSGLNLFLDNPEIPIDNNHVEREMRCVAVGRKNHYGSRSLRGTEAAALFYSLIESAKLAGLEPAAYLSEATRRAIADPGTVTLPAALLSTSGDTS